MFMISALTVGMRSVPFVLNETPCGPPQPQPDLSGNWSWARLNILFAAVHITLQLLAMSSSVLHKQKHSKLDTLTPVSVNYVLWQLSSQQFGVNAA